MAALPPLALYIHLPWCIRKCPYCDFNSHQQDKEADPLAAEKHYVAMLREDLLSEISDVKQRKVSSIFFGGGTPSLFSAESIQQILDDVRANLALTADCEITLEANPGASEQARFSGYRAAGVNRLSIGIQSFDDRKLKRLGRVHSSADAQHAVTAARAAGFDNFNLDLMYALPEQDLTEALADLEAAIALSPTHLSHYQLTLEPDTAFYRQPPPLPSDDLAWEMQQACQARLLAAGYGQYEVSAYAQPGKQCRHNLNYWQFGDYIGIGAGAHGKLSLAAGQIIRRSKRRSPTAWMNPDKNCLDEQRSLGAADLRFEALLNGLRLNQGVSWQQLQERANVAIADLQPALTELMARELLETDQLGIRTTVLGTRYLNEVLEQFLPNE